MILCSKQKDIYRVFQYHGAEHKTIFCYEAGLPLTVENCRKQPRHHPRCGTSFLFVVVVVSILVSSLVFSFVNWRNMWVRMGLHLLLLIPIVGVTYEFNRYVGGHDNKVTRFCRVRACGCKTLRPMSRTTACSRSPFGRSSWSFLKKKARMRGRHGDHIQ